MTEQQHPITPPPMLRRLWAQQAQRLDPHDPVAWIEHVATQAVRWGADQELEACIDVILAHPGLEHPELLVEVLRAARRPKPPSLKEQALAALDDAVMRGDCITISDALPTIRRALEQLDD